MSLKSQLPKYDDGAFGDAGEKWFLKRYKDRSPSEGIKKERIVVSLKTMF